MTAVPPTSLYEPTTPIDRERGRGLAFVGYGLLLATVFTAGLSGFMAMILAYDRKGQSGPIMRSHFGFQLRIFWICFILTLAAGAMGFSGLRALLSAPGFAPPVHASPDTQMISLATGPSLPVDVEGFSYGYTASSSRMPHKAALDFAIGSALMVAGALFSWIGPIYGMIRLASGRPIGRARA